MKVLILGSGGREHALAWKISQSKLLTELYCAPGNPGTSSLAKNIPLDIKDFKSIAEFIIEAKIELVVAGPEDPLVNGLRDYLESIPELASVIFIGPKADGARLEGSKDFAKEFMVRWDIPTAKYGSFNSQTIEQADKFLDSLSAPFVLKADGLAAGKGVVILDDRDESKRELRRMLGGKFGAAGNTVVIEEYLHGIELSVFVLTDGVSYLVLPEAKDYKRIGEGDTGLNTGGMGAVSPVPFAGEEFMKKVEERVIKPTVEGLKNDGIDYRGFVFIGLMNCGGDPYVIEYNVRMGDPETEAVMTRIDSDLLAHFVAVGNRTLSNEKMQISNKFAMTVISVAGGYPEAYEKGKEIVTPSEMPDNSVLFHSGTSIKDGKLVSSGGRVLALTVNSNSIPDARELAYNCLENINFEGIYYRKDIGIDLLKYL